MMLTIRKQKKLTTHIPKSEVNIQVLKTIYTYKHKLNACMDPRIHLLDPTSVNIPSTVRNVSNVIKPCIYKKRKNIYKHRIKYITLTSAIFWSIVIGSNMTTGRVTIDVISEPIYFCIIFQ